MVQIQNKSEISALKKMYTSWQISMKRMKNNHTNNRNCKDCEFQIAEEEQIEGKISGFSECWKINSDGMTVVLMSH